jgi:hypothetical protein
MPDPGAKFGADLYDLWRAGVPACHRAPTLGAWPALS